MNAANKLRGRIAHSIRKRWLRLAGNWITMAQEADKRERNH
jgi:hypothetical protein